ncbi:CorA-like domain protein [Streptococcus ictaluri 707-05]|uniref:CorA-like domain protein n=1 Tax=Streptococcus ictaluri 707-05 TaxID=764299 RepID=G5K660_9STRE|nr:CorA-like domain protein [Streptococcus ictaluri 707-05]
MRRELTKLHLHYEQLIDLAQEFYENENDFFAEENLRFFHLFSSRVSRLESIVLTLRESIVQIRELAHAQLEIRQNKIMTILTIVTTCCMPLTILVGWYGMNFKYMPELYNPLGYPAVIIFALFIFISAISFFKYKKWL